MQGREANGCGKRAARRHDASLFIVLHTALAVLLHLLSATAEEVNAVLPMASTTISADKPVPGHAEKYPAGLREALAGLRHAPAVAPLVAYLASPECTVNGEAYAAGFGRYARVFVGETVGWVADDGLAVTPSDIAEHLDQIRDAEGYAIPGDIYDEVRFIAASLGITMTS